MTMPAQSAGVDPALLRQTHGGTRFVKVTGPTGDWIVFYNPPTDFALTSADIITLCDRFRGIGATGVVLVREPAPRGAATHGHHHLAAWLATGDPLHHMSEPARAATQTMATLQKFPADETSHQVFHTDIGMITTVYTPAYIGVDIGQWSYADATTAEAAGSDALVMAAGLTDPRPGLSLVVERHHVVIAIETLDELAAINLDQQPSVEPTGDQPLSIGFVVPQDPLVAQGMGRLIMRHYNATDTPSDMGSATAAAAMAFQLWSGLKAPRIWSVTTPRGEIVVQLHDERRLSTFASLTTVFFGKL